MKMMLRSILILLLVAVELCSGAPSYNTCWYDKKSDTFTLKSGKNTTGMAWGYFQDDIETTGYGIVSIATNGDFPDEEQVICAGYLEGAITTTRIFQIWQNFWQSTFNATNYQKIVDFTAKTMQWTADQIEKHASSDSYWSEVELVLTQLEGIWRGYKDKAPTHQQLKLSDLFLLNMIGDLDDLIPALYRLERLERGEKVEDLAISEQDARNVILNSHCSAIVKPLADGSDLFVGHEMWASYLQLLNVFKYYDFALNTHSAYAKRVSFSSYPGFVSSEDDFYVLGSGLYVMETTNGIFNLSLYDAITPETLMSWIRVVVANRMARDAEQWVEIFKRFNSGTYNNQWMVVDFRKFKVGSKTLQPGTLWIGSQLPGYFFSKDVTSVVNQQGYWPSYNIPYFKEVFDLAGYPAMVKQYGDLWTYHNCPRAKIFRERHASVKDLKSLQELMRYNNWQKDPLSEDCPINQIAARGDLSPRNQTGFCAPAAFGAINAKITSYTFSSDLKASIISGPTHEYLAPFEWTPAVEQQFPNTKHFGQPKKFDFDWILFDPTD